MTGFHVERANGIINDIFYPHFDRKRSWCLIVVFFILILGELSVSDTTTKLFK